jgi:hypothetical protein
VAKQKGKKLDGGKLRYDLEDPRARELFVAVLTFGAELYGDDNWRKVPNLRKRYHAALERHLEAHRMGEGTDPTTGLPHLAHAMCCLHFLLAVSGAKRPNVRDVVRRARETRQGVLALEKLARRTKKDT